MPNSPRTWSEARAAARRNAEAMTAQEGARIARGIAADADARMLTDADFARMKPARRTGRKSGTKALKGRARAS